MSLTMHVTLSKKIGEANYGSRGGSVSLSCEADSLLINDPAKIRERLRHLFSVVREELALELGNGHATNSNGSGPTPPNGNGHHAQAENGHNGNGHGRHVDPEPYQHADDEGPRVATARQIKAIKALARVTHSDLSELARRHNVDRVERLSLDAASATIDELRARQGSGNGN